MLILLRRKKKVVTFDIFGFDREKKIMTWFASHVLRNGIRPIYFVGS